MAENENFTTGSNEWLMNLRLTQASCYIPLLIFGMAGNLYVINLLVQVLRGGITRRPPIYQYILSLSFVDLAFLILSWLLVYYIFNGSWDLGIVLCKLLWIGESLNKTFSVYLLVWLSYDRYRAVHATSGHQEGHRHNVFLRFVLPTAVGVSLTCLPLYIFTQVDTYTVRNDTHGMCRPVFPELSNDTLPKGVSTNLQSYYFLLLFVLFFLIPATLISSFYIQLLRRLNCPTTTLQANRKRQATVTKSVSIVVIFYVLCWGPYWIFQVTITVLQITNTPIGGSRAANVTFNVMQSIIYTLPFVNSGLNPIFYGVLNRNLRKEYKQSLSRRQRTPSGRRPFGSVPLMDIRERLLRRNPRLAIRIKQLDDARSQISRAEPSKQHLVNHFPDGGAGSDDNHVVVSDFQL